MEGQAWVLEGGRFFGSARQGGRLILKCAVCPCSRDLPSSPREPQTPFLVLMSGWLQTSSTWLPLGLLFLWGSVGMKLNFYFLLLICPMPI